MAPSNSKSEFKRKRVLVEPRIQLALAKRVALYWVSCVAVVNIMPSFIRVAMELFYGGVSPVWLGIWSQVLGVAFFLPLICYDIIRLSNRFAGPMFRLKANMRLLAEGHRVEPIRFRDNDFWHDFAEQFNAVLARVQSQPQVARQDETPSETVGCGA
jgi:hypothetical protein